MLVLRPGALGDTLLAVPALRSLRRAAIPLTLAAHAGGSRLLERLGEVDRGIAFDDPSLAWIFQDVEPPEPVVAWMSSEGAPALGHAAVVAASRPTADQCVHVARYLLGTLAPLGIEVTWDDSPLNVPPLVSDDVLLHPGSGASRKNWPAEKFANVIRRIRFPVRLVVGEADFRAADSVQRHLDKPLPRLVLPPLDELASRLAGCRGYLGNDSGVSHLAGLCGTRTIALFGPTNPDVWRPLGPDVHALPFSTNPVEVTALLNQ